MQAALGTKFKWNAGMTSTGDSFPDVMRTHKAETATENNGITCPMVDLENMSSKAQAVVTWERLMGNPKLDEHQGNLAEFLSKWSKIPREELATWKIPVWQVISKVRKNILSEKRNILEELEEALPAKDIFGNAKGSWTNLFVNGKTEGEGFSGFDVRWASKSIPMLFQQTNSGISSFSRLDFTLYVPFTEGMKAKLKNGAGFARMFEGGVAEITNEFKDDYEVESLQATTNPENSCFTLNPTEAEK
jgi:hypothetical protein